MLSVSVCNGSNLLVRCTGTAQSKGTRIKAQMSQLGICLCPAGPSLQLESWGLLLYLGSVHTGGGQSS